MILPFLLHHANRAVKDVFYFTMHRDAFYQIKDKLLKRGKHINYDVQHIPGKKCHTCGGTGIYHGYYEMSGQPWYDTCNRCWRGWFKLPTWICLSRIKFGRYYFHRPLKRETCVRNPFTKEELGWEVTSRPLIEGYIDHYTSFFGRPSLLILFFIYNRDVYHEVKDQLIRGIRNELRWKWQRVTKLFKKKPIAQKVTYLQEFDDDGNIVDYHPF